MQELVGLSVNLQLILVAGYLAYKVTTVGKGNTDRTEDFLLKVLTFGLIARLLAEIVATIVKAAVHDQQHLSVLAAIQAKGLSVVLIALFLAVAWRKFGSKQVSSLMERGDVYRDDHEASTWLSVTNAKAEWNHVQVHLEDGTILESAFARTPSNIPTARLVVNEDGILIYVTKVRRPDGSELVGDDFADETYSTATFVPRSKIVQLDIGWKQR